MVKIRLQRIGAKNQPKYRIVVADEQVSRDGKVIEIIGNYDPTTAEAVVNIKTERLAHWLSLGAQPTKAVSDLAKRYERSNRVRS